MTGRLTPEVRAAAAWVLGVAAAVVLLLQVGRMVPDRPLMAGAIALGVLALGVSLAEPAVIPLFAVPAIGAPPGG